MENKRKDNSRLWKFQLFSRPLNSDPTKQQQKSASKNFRCTFKILFDISQLLHLLKYGRMILWAVWEGAQVVRFWNIRKQARLGHKTGTCASVQFTRLNSWSSFPGNSWTEKAKYPPSWQNTKYDRERCLIEPMFSLRLWDELESEMAAVQWRSLAFLLMTLFLSLHCLSFLLLDKFGKGESVYLRLLNLIL